MERNACNITECLKFLYQNKTINLSTQMPHWISKHLLLTNSFEAVTSGGTWVKVRELRVRNSFSQRVVRQTLLMFGYTRMFEMTVMYLKELCILLCTTLYACWIECHARQDNINQWFKIKFARQLLDLLKFIKYSWSWNVEMGG